MDDGLKKILSQIRPPLPRKELITPPSALAFLDELIPVRSPEQMHRSAMLGEIERLQQTYADLVPGARRPLRGTIKTLLHKEYERPVDSVSRSLKRLANTSDQEIRQAPTPDYKLYLELARLQSYFPDIFPAGLESLKNVLWNRLHSEPYFSEPKNPHAAETKRPTEQIRKILPESKK